MLREARGLRLSSWTREGEGGCRGVPAAPQPRDGGGRAPAGPRCVPAGVCRLTAGAGTWPRAGAATRRGTAGEREEGWCQSRPLAHGPQPAGCRHLRQPQPEPPPSTGPSAAPPLTFAPAAVRMLSALGTRRAVLVFLRAEMEVTGTTTCAGGGTRQCQHVPSCCPCPPPEPPARAHRQPTLMSLSRRLAWKQMCWEEM